MSGYFSMLGMGANGLIPDSYTGARGAGGPIQMQFSPEWTQAMRQHAIDTGWVNNIGSSNEQPLSFEPWMEIPGAMPQTQATYPWTDGYGLGTGNTNMGSFSSSNPSLPTSLDLNNMTMSDRAFVPNGVSTAGLSSFDSGAPAPQTFMQKAGNWASNGNNLQGAAAALGALTQAWMGYQGLKTARDQISFQKKTWQKNFENQTKTYNTRLEDRIRGRTADYSNKENDVQSYLNKHKLST